MPKSSSVLRLRGFYRWEEMPKSDDVMRPKGCASSEEERYPRAAACRASEAASSEEEMPKGNNGLHPSGREQREIDTQTRHRVAACRRGFRRGWLAQCFGSVIRCGASV